MTALIGHADLARELRALALSEEPPHALLFAGPEGTGRRALAVEYALLLNCEALHPPAGGSLFREAAPRAAAAGDACGECRACRLIAEGAHPDVIAVSPGDTLCKPREGDSHGNHAESSDIRICQVRGMVDLASRYPFEAAYRVLIVDPAERLTPDACNALLKTLEEPPGHTVFCLLTSAPEAIMETVLSRCRRVDVGPVGRALIEEALVARGVGRDLAAGAAEAARGRPGRAIAFAAQPDLMADRGRLLERCGRLAGASLGERFKHASGMAERWRGDQAGLLAELDAWESFWEDRLRTGSGELPAEDLAGCLEALRAIATARADLRARLMPRLVFEFMLLRFPRVTLAGSPEEEPPAHG